MKLYAFPMLACALLLCALPSVAFADLIMPNTHSIEKCVKITGLDAYQNYTFIGVVSPISSGAPLGLVQIKNGLCIDAGSHYKFDSFSVYYANKSYFEKVGISGIKTGNLSVPGECPGGCTRQGITDENLALLGGDYVSAPYAPYYAGDSDPSKSVTIEYRLECQQDADKCMSITGCGVPHIIGCNLTKAKEEKSNQPLNATGGVQPPVPQGSSSPLAAFWCWLLGLFGQAC
ncbi:MAG: hypothetical protein NTX79_03325 [Candidatus Micrarchaeota archaeon]|nr:hypothetical protein [Candidatus Micrarchaeota archaeon]